MAAQKNDQSESDKNAFKHLIGPKLVERLATAFARHYKPFDKVTFLKLKTKLDVLEMKPRVFLICEELKKQLPEGYLEALKIVVLTCADDSLSGFDFWPHTAFVQKYGLEHVKDSLIALQELTKVFTAEWAVRPYLICHQQITLKFLLQCARDKNVHVRRWASEGTRPRLPWGERLNNFVNNPEPAVAILDVLKFDEELYIRKSVSNHLNDIAKSNPDFVIKILTRWQREAGAEHSQKIKWIISRALRTLIKDGHQDALRLIGVGKQLDVRLENFRIDRNKIKLGDKLNFAFEVRSTSRKTQKVVIDYVIHFVKSNNKKSPKVFKLKTLQLGPQEIIDIAKNHLIKKITTRTYYSGLHRLEIKINGKVLRQQDWSLTV